METFISGFYGDMAVGVECIKEGFFFENNCGGGSVWTIGPRFVENSLWSTQYKGTRYAYVFYPYDMKCPGFDELLAEMREKGVSGDLHVSYHDCGCVIQVDALLPGWDVDTDGSPYPGSELWYGKEADDLSGTLTLIDTTVFTLP